MEDQKIQASIKFRTLIFEKESQTKHWNEYTFGEIIFAKIYPKIAKFLVFPVETYE